MKVILLTAVNLKSTEGIYKKVLAEATALKNTVGEGWLIHATDKGTKIVDLSNMVAEENRTNIFETAIDMIYNNHIEIIYIRHMVPSIGLIRFLSQCKHAGVKILYEIPTYPYYGEQIKASRNKPRTILRLTYETVFWPMIYSKLDYLVVIKSNTKVKMYSKMVCITNGVDPKGIKQKSYTKCNNDIVSFVAVGTLYPYHGYDRLLYGFKKYGTEVDGKSIQLHFVGDSPTIKDLEVLSRNLELNNVYFHGVKTTAQLNELYEDFDIGLGCLALHRRNADIDTTLKIVEYYCRSVPVVTSGESPMDVYHPEYTIHVEDSEEPIDIIDLIHQYSHIRNTDKIWETACDKFSWKYIMEDLMQRTNLLRSKEYVSRKND